MLVFLYYPHLNRHRHHQYCLRQALLTTVRIYIVVDLRQQVPKRKYDQYLYLLDQL
jgi:hypothetical protein